MQSLKILNGMMEPLNTPFIVPMVISLSPNDLTNTLNPKKDQVQACADKTVI